MPSARVTPKIPDKYLTAPTKMVSVSVCNTRTLHNRLRGRTLAKKVWLSRVVEIAPTRGAPRPTHSGGGGNHPIINRMCSETSDPQFRSFFWGKYDVDRSSPSKPLIRGQIHERLSFQSFDNRAEWPLTKPYHGCQFLRRLEGRPA